MQTKPRRRPSRHRSIVTSTETTTASEAVASQGQTTSAPPWSIDHGERDIASAPMQLEGSGPALLLLERNGDRPAAAADDLSEKNLSTGKGLSKAEVVGLSITVAGVLLAMLLLYLYVFSALSGARNQNQLLHSLTGDPRAIFSLASGHEPRNGQPVAILNIPSIGLHQAVVEGTTAADLQKGPGLVSTSGLSGLPGESGDAVIAGRRVSFGGPFSRLSDLHQGSIIDVVDGAGAFKFSVTKVETLSQGQVAVPTYGRSWLTLVTSDSPWVPTGKMIVVARIVGQPASAKSTVSSRESLPTFSGDPAAGILAGLWALAFLVVLGLMVLAIRRWRQTWVSWLLAAPILLACGLFACESLARCLPSTL
jgi:sortase A